MLSRPLVGEHDILGLEPLNFGRAEGTRDDPGVIKTYENAIDTPDETDVNSSVKVNAMDLPSVRWLR